MLDICEVPSYTSFRDMQKQLCMVVNPSGPIACVIQLKHHFTMIDPEGIIVMVCDRLQADVSTLMSVHYSNLHTLQ